MKKQLLQAVKMADKMQFVALIMGIMFSMAIFASCSSDDDDDRFNIVGTWMEIDSDEDVYVYLYSNGAGKFTEKGRSNTFTYIFYEDSKVIEITTNGRTERATLTILSKDKFVLMGDTYMRIE